ncbi:MAG: DNA replication/repair protein RecF [Firmicutes bacterium]|nr:DNA replication/repair protein RecF [Bacillota bacterium]
MILKNISLKNFTNYEDAYCDFDENINIFVGDNAQGKSNLLESIYYISTISSSKKNKDRELIKWGRDYFSISAHFFNQHGENKVSVKVVGNKKEVYLNNYKIEKRKEYIGYLITVIFNPEDLYIIKGEPALRRQYIDNELSKTDVEYFVDSIKYKKVLEQRNILLKEYKRKKVSDELMDIWEEQLSKYGIKIINKRLELIDQLKEISKKIHYRITDDAENLQISYQTNIDIENIEDSYRQLMKKNRQKDIERGYTSVGPHRDDLEILINGISAKKFASQGQQRTISLSLKISEIEFIKRKTGEYPILLLDDVLSELDKNRKHKLLEEIENKVQTIITTTDLNDIENFFIDKGKIIIIQDGKVL